MFFFKQKTAYEMRISDWSSDVCSSDLGPGMALLSFFVPPRSVQLHLSKRKGCPMSGRFISFVENLSRVCGLLAALLLVFSMLVVCEMIFLLYIFRAATIWQTEAVVFSATAAIFLGAPYVLLTKGHVGVDFIQLVGKPRTS